MNLEIKEIINNLKLANKKNLDKIYLQIEDDEKTEIINLESGEKTKHSEISKSNLLIKMNMNTLLELKENKKNPEDLLFEEKIKISGDIKLLQ
ncbi:MAG: SCP2 sterol-binding domain-containing protein [Actinomycetota bacterium]|nr:SCP2 sterol-binding domain-containing protein [Actinomycetota bacterium]